MAQAASNSRSRTDAETNDEAEFAYERGQYFADHVDPNVKGMVVIDTGYISGYKGVRVAEKDTQTDEWFAYWCKESYIINEVDLGAAKATKTLAEDMVEGVESNVRASDKAAAAASQRVRLSRANSR